MHYNFEKIKCDEPRSMYSFVLDYWDSQPKMMAGVCELPAYKYPKHFVCVATALSIVPIHFPPPYSTYK